MAMLQFFRDGPYVNDDWEAFHADRIKTEQRNLYPYKKRLCTIMDCAS
jgi:hypothetical protein